MRKRYVDALNQLYAVDRHRQFEPYLALGRVCMAAPLCCGLLCCSRIMNSRGYQSSGEQVPHSSLSSRRLPGRSRPAPLVPQQWAVPVRLHESVSCSSTDHRKPRLDSQISESEFRTPPSPPHPPPRTDPPRSPALRRAAARGIRFVSHFLHVARVKKHTAMRESHVLCAKCNNVRQNLIPRATA